MITAGEIEILKALQKRNMAGPKLFVGGKKIQSQRSISFTDLNRKVGLPRAVLSECLKKLEESGLVQKNISTREYYLTKENEVALIIAEATENLKSQPVKETDR